VSAEGLRDDGDADIQCVVNDLLRRMVILETHVEELFMLATKTMDEAQFESETRKQRLIEARLRYLKEWDKGNADSA